MKNYILTYNVAQASFAEQNLVAFIQANRSVSEWLVPYPGTFLIKSPEDFVQVYISFRRFFGSATNFLFSKIDINETAGVMSEQAWDWLNRGVLPEDMAKRIAERRLKAGSPEAIKFEDDHA